jgi:hypothetical protein
MSVCPKRGAFFDSVSRAGRCLIRRTTVAGQMPFGSRRGAASRRPRSTTPPERAALADDGEVVRFGTPELTAGLIRPGTGMSSATEGRCSERIGCERGVGSRKLGRARSGLDDPYGHLSRLRLSDGRSGPVCVLPSRGSALAPLRPAATAVAGPNPFGANHQQRPVRLRDGPIRQNVSDSGGLSVTSRSLHDPFQTGGAA